MLIIVNRKRVMGSTNSRFVNMIGWATMIVIGGLSIVYVAQTVLGSS